MIICDVKLGSLKQWWSELPSYSVGSDIGVPWFFISITTIDTVRTSASKSCLDILQAVTVPVQFFLHNVVHSKLKGSVSTEGETEVIPPQVGVTWEVLCGYNFIGLPSILCGMRMIICDVKLGSLKQWRSELPSYILQAVTVPVQFPSAT